MLSTTGSKRLPVEFMVALWHWYDTGEAQPLQDYLDTVRGHPVFQDTLHNDGDFEYSVTADCDGSNAVYIRRSPKREVPVGEWERTNEAAFSKAAERSFEDRMKGVS